MEFLNELSETVAKPKLIPMQKQPERRLLSVFMSLVELSSEVRGQFFDMCGYGAGRTCSLQSYMEVSYNKSKYSDVRPDGLVFAKRGSNTWSAFIEAKARTSKIRPEQIIDYIDLAASVDVDAVISISNEFARSPEELPYTIPLGKMKKRSVYHFAWADIRTFLERVKHQANLEALEAAVLDQCLEFFWHDDSGVSTFDKMPQDWPKFVDSARTGVGFSTKTPGITEIVHAWQQERRDLCSKLSHTTKQSVELRHSAGVRSTPDQRLKEDRARLANQYELEARYYFKETKSELVVTADLVNRKITFSLSISAPENKKAKASITWLTETASGLSVSPLDIVVTWKGRGQVSSFALDDLRSEPEAAWAGQKERPRGIQIITSLQSAADFRSAKKFIASLEGRAGELVSDGSAAGWI